MVFRPNGQKNLPLPFPLNFPKDHCRSPAIIAADTAAPTAGNVASIAIAEESCGLCGLFELRSQSAWRYIWELGRHPRESSIRFCAGEMLDLIAEGGHAPSAVCRRSRTFFTWRR